MNAQPKETFTAVGVVEEFGTSQSGKRKVKIGGHNYWPGRTDTNAMQIGQTVEVVYNLFGERMNMRGLNQWKAAETGRQAPVGSSRMDSQSAIPPEGLPFLSNTIAHAITAGVIKTPEDMVRWSAAVRLVLTSKPTASPPPRESENPADGIDPDFNDSVPF